MKRLFSVLLCATLMLSAFATVASASEEVLTSVFFASDPQFYPSYTRASYGDNTLMNCKPVVDTLVQLAKEYNHNIETFVFGGDYSQNQSGLDANDPKNIEIYGTPTTPGNANTFPWHYGNDPKYGIADIKDAIANYYTVDDKNQIFIQGNHEPDVTETNTYGLAPGGAYEFDEYVVYVINDQDLAGPRPRTENLSSSTNIALDENGNQTVVQITDPKAVVTKTANELETYLNAMIANGDDRPVFIASHQPLYSERFKDYNGYAYLIADVINEAAETLDIIFFFGHTHQAVDQIGGGLSYVARGETLKVASNPNVTSSLSSYTLTDSDYKNMTLNFTYMNFGHLARYSGTNGNILSSTVIDITPTELKLTRYRSKSSYASDAEKILDTKVITRINPAKEDNPVIDGNGETKTLANGEVYNIPSGTTYKNGTIDATDGTVIMKGLKLSGVIEFDENGKVGVKKGNTVKIAEGASNTFLLKDAVNTNNSYTVTVKNNTTSNSADVTFNFAPIYSGDVMFRLNIDGVPSNADLTVLYK